METYIVAVSIIMLPAAVVGFIFLRKYLGLKAFEFPKFSLKWFVEGFVMKRYIAFPILKAVVLNLVGIVYIWIALAMFFGSFGYFGTSASYALFLMFIVPVLFRAFYECMVFVIPMMINAFICFGMFLTSRIRYYSEENEKYAAE